MPLAPMGKEDCQEVNLKWYCMTVVVNRGPLKVPADDQLGTHRGFLSTHNVDVSE